MASRVRGTTVDVAILDDTAFMGDNASCKLCKKATTLRLGEAKGGPPCCRECAVKHGWDTWSNITNLKSLPYIEKQGEGWDGQPELLAKIFQGRPVDG